MLTAARNKGQFKVIEMKEISGSTLRHLVSFMYGHRPELSPQMVLPLFVVADAHQVSTLLAAVLWLHLHAH